MSDLVITTSQVVPATTALLRSGLAGEAILPGQVVYYDLATQRYKLARNTTATLAAAKGIAVNKAEATGQPIDAQYDQLLTLGAGAAIVVGQLYLLSGAFGGIMPVSDLAAGMLVSVLGVGAIDNAIALNIFASGQVRA